MLYLGKSPFYDKQEEKFIWILKIGYTDDIKSNRRLLMYTTHNPSFEFLHTIAGGTEEHEGKLLEKFKHLLHHGREWFIYSQEIIDYFNSVSLEDIEKLPIPLLSLERRNKYPLLKNREFMFIFERVLKEEIGKEGSNLTMEDFKTILNVVKLKSTTPEEVLEDIHSSGHFPKFSSLVLPLSDIVPKIKDEHVIQFFKNYDGLKTYLERLSYLCEWLILHPEDTELITENIPESDRVRKQILTLGPERIKSLGYNVTRIREAMGITIFDQSILEKEIYSRFNTGDRLTKAEIKNILRVIYDEVGYKKTPKAIDLEKWFEVRLIAISNQKTGKRDHGFEILSSKQNN